ncbi:MAG TPA: aldolase/citrate lyase family protein [Gaiellaceae bacterium]|nr:aldolase/citrate lyase family protein [Gaiellaceae bacterium]
MNAVKQRLAEGGTAIGTMVTELATPGIARLAAAAGAEFVLFDMEHTGYDFDRLRSVLAAAEASGTVPFLRVPDADYHFVSRGLDIGARGLMVPSVEDAEEAQAIARAARFPPVGKRGFGLIPLPAELAHLELPAALAAVNDATLVLVQVETAAGLERVDEIAAVDGVDVLWIGHFDLTASLGIPGEFTSDRYREALDRVLAAGRAHGKPVGMVCGSVEEGAGLLERGFRLLAYSIDVLLYQEGVRAGIAGLASARDAIARS